jgi:hypothetical protein
MSDSQNLGDAFADLGRQLGNALADLGFVAAGQGAMGWMLQGEASKAREALADLTAEQRAGVADAARKLAVLAEHKFGG